MKQCEEARNGGNAMVAVGGNQPRVSSWNSFHRSSPSDFSRRDTWTDLPFLARSSSQLKIREGSPLLSSLEQPPSERNFFRGKLPDFNQKRSFSARQKIGKSRDFDPPRVFNSGSGATPGWENASRGQVSRFSGAMTRSKTQRALKPLVTYVHARCGRY